MERARVIWEELGLAPLKPQAPWYGYSLGDWHEDLDQEAELAVRSEYFQTGEKIAKQRARLDDVWINSSFYGEKKLKEK
jgi:4-hydroxy-3-polyprenylbenzoate decarboxylase